MHTRRPSSISFAAGATVFLLFATALPAQNTRKLKVKDLPPSAFKLISIKVTGARRYQAEDVIAACGLQTGQTASEDDFKRAARELGETGAFSDVLYTFQYSPEGTKLELQVKDAERFVPVRFDNVPWFSDQELIAKVHSRVPLFHGELPIAGTLVNEVSDALQNLVSERNPQARTDYVRETAHGREEGQAQNASADDNPITRFVFSVSGPRIRIRKIAFSGAAAGETPLLEGAAQKLLDLEYSRATIREEDNNFRDVYRARGYVKVKFGEAQATAVEDGSEVVLVDVTIPVERGPQYKLTQLQWSGNQQISTETLRALIHTQVNQSANAVQLDRDIEEVEKLYGTRGYVAAKIQPVPEFDEAASSVSYRIEVEEGDVYHMGDLEILGLDSRTTEHLLDHWKLRGGDPYDSSYPNVFRDKILKEISATGPWKVGVHETLDRKDKTVDVSFRFDPKR